MNKKDRSARRLRINRSATGTAERGGMLPAADTIVTALLLTLFAASALAEVLYILF